MARMVAIEFPQLMTDRTLRLHPELRDKAFVLAQKERGRRVIKAVNLIAQEKGAYINMPVADCKAIVPELQVLEYDPEQPPKLLSAMAEWCIRYAPYVSLDLPDGLILDASGCTHLWGDEELYLRDIRTRFHGFGYETCLAIADTIGAAWAVSRFGKELFVIAPGAESDILSMLPPAALRLEQAVTERLEKLGLNTMGSFMKMPRTALRRRFGQNLLMRLDQALGYEMENTVPVRPVAPYEERLASLEPIRTAPGIEIALNNLLEELCKRLVRESKGLRKAELRCYRVDGNVQKIAVNTSRPSRNPQHLFRLFKESITRIEPDLGIELFILEAAVVEELLNAQDVLWKTGTANESAVAELLDRISSRIGAGAVCRYLPEEHYWPERSVRPAASLTEKAATPWRTDLPRPLHLLPKPERIDVTVPLPDYPPILFRYKGILHTVKKADGPERIEQEWWIQRGLYRDYYCVEDENGSRYWLFRSGDYNKDEPKWFMHGFFA